MISKLNACLGFAVGFVLGASALSAQGADTKASVSATTEASSVRQGPRLLKPSEHGVGRFVPDAAFTDIAGKSGRLSDFKSNRLLVISMTSTSCPLSKKYLPTLAEFAKQYGDKDVRFLLVNPVPSDAAADVQQSAATFGSQTRYVHDKTGALAKTVGALTTTDVLVLDASRTVVYHGAVDDQYGFGYSLDKPRQSYLIKALNALLAGQRPEVAATDAPGCALELADAPFTRTEVTYHNRISRIIQNQCQECHREGGVAPFSLEKPDDVVAHRGMIKQVLEKGTMPPWFAAPPKEGEETPWRNDRALAAADKTDLLAWLAGGSPAGNAADAPLPRSFPREWQIGEPDVVLQLPKPFAIKATGTMPYQNATVETSFDEDKWVQALELQPTSRDVVHHVLVFVIPKETGDGKGEVRRESGGEERRGFFAAYVPGNSTIVYPDGFAKKLPKGATLRFQLHYTPAGKETEDQTRLGLIFAKAPVEHEVHVVGIANPLLRIPAGADNHPESATIRVPTDVKLMAMMPHMHLRGKAFRYEATLPDGSSRLLLDVPRYDFNWQLAYRLAEPQTLPAGTTLKATGWYDNSDKNPANPDAEKTVRWGPQTFDEMMLGYIEFYLPGGGSVSSGFGIGDEREHINALLFKQLDADADGSLTLAEVRNLSETIPRLKVNGPLLDIIFTRLDADKDGKVTPTEFGKVREILGRP